VETKALNNDDPKVGQELLGKGKRTARNGEDRNP
jgi:hypothetical protein